MEAAVEHMDREAAMNLVCGERHHLGSLTALGAVVLPPEGDAVDVEGGKVFCAKIMTSARVF